VVVKKALPKQDGERRLSWFARHVGMHVDVQDMIERRVGEMLVSDYSDAGHAESMKIPRYGVEH
jgi:hypothetical protein